MGMFSQKTYRKVADCLQLRVTGEQTRVRVVHFNTKSYRDNKITQ